MTFDHLQRRSTGDVTQPSSCSQSKPTIESRCTTTEQAPCRSTDDHPGPRTCAFGWLTRRTSARPTRSRDTMHLHSIPRDPTSGGQSQE